MMAGECVDIDGPVVRVAALARFARSPASISPNHILIETPDPGNRRWLSPAEMRLWGLAPKEDMPMQGICVQRRLQRLTSEDVAQAVQDGLLARHGIVKLVQITSLQPSVGPVGQLRLAPSGPQLLSRADDFCSFLWRGAIEYDAHRTVPIRVLGRFQLAQAVFVARRDLQAGDVLTPADYEQVVRAGCSARMEAEPEMPEGSILKQPLRSGDAIQPLMLKAPLAVLQGETVRVVARVGGAAVGIDAEAERQGRRGESILVHNRETGKRIRVLLTGKGEGSAACGGQ
jgi:flagella basal body P-ring formation protein FlgA